MEILFARTEIWPGGWRIGGDRGVLVMQPRRPIFLHRWLMRALLGICWSDEPRGVTVDEPRGVTVDG